MAINVLSMGWRSSGFSCLPTLRVAVQQDQPCHLFPAAAQGHSSSLLSKDKQEQLESSCSLGFALSLSVPHRTPPLAWNAAQKIIGRVFNIDYRLPVSPQGKFLIYCSKGRCVDLFLPDSGRKVAACTWL